MALIVVVGADGFGMRYDFYPPPEGIGREEWSTGALVHYQATFSVLGHPPIALVCARRNLQSAICNLQLH